MMTLEEAVRLRHSVRSYTDEPLGSDDVEALRAKVAEANEQGLLDIQLVLDEPKAFTGFKARFGRFSGARNYLALVGPECKELDEVCGYFGEQLVLLAQQRGLNSCWVGGTYRMVSQAYRVDLGCKLAAIIALGHGATQGVPHQSKEPSEVAPGYDEAPSWFQRGVDCALLAPTALNQQKFGFQLIGQDEDGTPQVRASTKRGPFAKMDLGIARLHFEIGAAGEPFLWT